MLDVNDTHHLKKIRPKFSERHHQLFPATSHKLNIILILRSECHYQLRSNAKAFTEADFSWTCTASVDEVIHRVMPPSACVADEKLLWIYGMHGSGMYAWMEGGPFVPGRRGGLADRCDFCLWTSDRSADALRSTHVCCCDRLHAVHNRGIPRSLN